MKKIGFRSALKMLGAKDIELHANGGVACTEWSGFLTGTGVVPGKCSAPLFKDGQTYYVSFSNDHLGGLPSVMHREAKDRKDFSGGNNNWSMEGILERMGYALKPMTDTRKPRC